MLLRLKKKSSKIVPESPHTVHGVCQATSVLKEYDCWVDCVFLRTSLWKVARFTSEWNKFHILELTHQEIDLSPLVQSEALCHSLSLARLFRCQAFFQFEISSSCCWPYVMHTDGVINVIKKPAVINRLKHSSSCTTCCNTENICFLCTDCAYVFHVVLTVNIYYFPNSISQLVFVMERQPVCSCLTYQLHKFQTFWGCFVLMY